MNLPILVQQALLGLQDSKAKTFFFPEQASTIAQDSDKVFYFIYWVSVISFVLVIGATVLFAWKYRAREGTRAIKTSTHDNTLEVSWTIIPTILVAIMFWAGFKGFLDLRRAPENSYEIQVTGFQWAWSFRYPNGTTSDELHVPADKPVRLLMTSSDVLHSLFVPAFRVKQDVVPGRYTSLWFEATPPETSYVEGAATYDLFCTEYCGTRHSGMITKCVVHETQEGFDEWLEVESDYLLDVPPVEGGALVYQKKGCTQCHVPFESMITDSQTGYGPPFEWVSRAIAQGEEIQFADGTSIVPDENYIRESVLLPNAKKRPEYAAAGKNMPSYQGNLKDEEISALIAWMKSLQASKQ
ncbi:MAG: cytochrome c oxidase subunit II [Planctomycetota bacterium]|jgi:cytochrome c oxidase subunit 2